MADNQESIQVAGSGGTPSPTPSSNEGVSPSGAGAQAQSPLESITEQLKRMAGEINALKSEKDKGVHAVQKEVSDLRDKIARYEKLRAKMTPEEALDELEHGSTLQDQLTALQEQMRTLVERGGNGTPTSGPQLAAQAFSTVGLDPNDPDVRIAISEVADKTPAEIKLAAYELRERKAAQPNPTSAQGSSITEQTPPTVDKAALQKEYDAQAAKLRGNASAIAQLKQDFRKKGLSIW